MDVMKLNRKVKTKECFTVLWCDRFYFYWNVYFCLNIFIQNNNFDFPYCLCSSVWLYTFFMCFLTSISRKCSMQCWSATVSPLYYAGVHAFLLDTTLNIDFIGWYSYMCLTVGLPTWPLLWVTFFINTFLSDVGIKWDSKDAF